MPLPDELAVVDITWAIETNKEIAVNRFYLQHVHHETNSFGWPDACQTIADKVVSSMNGGAGSGTLSHIVNNIALAKVDAYAIDRTTGLATARGESVPAAGTVRGTASGAYIPLLGAVLQLWGYAAGDYVTHPRRRRGRLFLPGTPDSLFANTGELSEGSAAAIATDWGAFFNDIQGMHVGDSFGVGGGPTDSMNTGVMSRVDGAFYQLERVTCAYKPGIQHRRMNKLANSRSAETAISHG